LTCSTFCIDPEEVRALGLDRGVAAAVHDKIGICAYDAGGIDPERQRAVSRIGTCRIDPRLGFLVIPPVLPHYRLLPM
jgi:hypothetical protein